MNSGEISFPDVNLNDKDMEIKDYLSTDSNFDIVLDVFVKTDEAVDVNAQAQTINRLADEFGLKNVYLDIINRDFPAGNLT